MSFYNSQFYKSFVVSSEKSARNYFEQLFKVYKPTSIVDLGCGVGCWLRAAHDLGITNIYGIDGSYVNKSQLRITENCFHAVDLSKTFPELVKADLAISLEVAEHLQENRSQGFVDYLCNCSDIILFGAAVPFQGGTDHVNEQWQTYWVEKFLKNGYHYTIDLRSLVWGNKDIDVWYRQNTLLFVKPAKVNLFPYIFFSKIEPFVDVVHPLLFSLKMLRYQKLNRFLEILQHYYNKIRSLYGGWR